mmetsp:Transcript_12669/g.30926  ORF Transcript_12669/g.30926 Transcript_12669/m.30926 type:complete len:119 (-) Transcript_12669:228-584(-)
MPLYRQFILSLYLASGVAVGWTSSFVAPPRTTLLLNRLRSNSLLESDVQSLSQRVAGRLFGRRGGGGGKKEKKSSKANLPEKICVVCGRPFTWRKKWERCWDEVTCCSKSCNSKRRSV